MAPPYARIAANGWLVTIAGQFKFRKAYEPNGAYVASSFNHYSRNGSVYVTSTGDPLSTWASGFSLEGLEFLPAAGGDKLCRETPSAEQINGRIGNNHSAFGGGTDMDGDGHLGDGDEPPRPSASPTTCASTSRRSALATGSRSSQPTSDAATERAAPSAPYPSRPPCGRTPSAQVLDRTAGQDRLPLCPRTPHAKPDPIPPERGVMLGRRQGGQGVSWRTVLPPGPARWLIDNRQTGYYTHPDSPPLHIERREQEWTYPHEQVLPQVGGGDEWARRLQVQANQRQLRRRGGSITAPSLMSINASTP